MVALLRNDPAGSSEAFRQPPRRAVATDRPPASAPKAEASHGLSRTLSDTACRSRIRRCSQRRSRATQTRAWFSVSDASFALSPDRAYVGGQAARSTGMRSRLEGSLHGAIATCVLLATATARPPSDSFEDLVDVGGHRLYVKCTGRGGPTVILEAGLGNTSTTWAQVQPEVARFTTVCSYDRAGLGKKRARSRSAHEPDRRRRAAGAAAKRRHPRALCARRPLLRRIPRAALRAPGRRQAGDGRRARRRNADRLAAGARSLRNPDARADAKPGGRGHPREWERSAGGAGLPERPTRRTDTDGRSARGSRRVRAGVAGAPASTVEALVPR